MAKPLRKRKWWNAGVGVVNDDDDAVSLGLKEKNWWKPEMRLRILPLPLYRADIALANYSLGRNERNVCKLIVEVKERVL